MPATVRTALLDVSCQTTTSCYAVGNNKSVVRLNGTTWSYTFAPTSGAPDYNGVDMYPSGTRVIIVGNNGVGFGEWPRWGGRITRDARSPSTAQGVVISNPSSGAH